MFTHRLFLHIFYFKINLSYFTCYFYTSTLTSPQFDKLTAPLISFGNKVSRNIVKVWVVKNLYSIKEVFCFYQKTIEGNKPPHMLECALFPR